jgi:hypothetical protein
MDNRNAFPFSERLHCRDERLTDRIHQSAGDELKTAVVPKETGHPNFPLQLRHVNIQVQPVDSLDLQGHVVGQHLSNGSWYAHSRLRYDSDPSGSTAASAA